ncbi:MAG TPA: DUF6714 family protein [Verrucomicrobiae bacterium]
MNLRTQIAKAFADVPYPGDDNITFSQCEEAQHVLHYLCGKKWHELSIQELRYANALSWLSEAGFQHYLPAYLLAVTTDIGKADVMVLELKYAFIPPRRLTGAANSTFASRIQCLTDAQKETILLTFQKLAHDGAYDETDLEMLHRTFMQFGKA